MGRERHLRPGQDYYFEVSMYQKGAKGLYLQDCDEDPKFFACDFRWLGLGRTEGSIYSEPLKVPFSTEENLRDDRSIFQKIGDFIK